MLAGLRRWRRGTWLWQGSAQTTGAHRRCRGASAELALEVTECARLIKGYGDTWKRGAGNYQLIEMQVIRPALAGHIPLARAIDAVASARTAALRDPDGGSLARCLAEIAQQSAHRIAAE